MSVVLGQVVKSKAGRDYGRYFIVVQLTDDKYIMVSDGQLRRIEKPKKKKLKHLELTSDVIGALNEKLYKNVKVSNADIRKALADLKDKNNEINPVADMCTD